MTASDKTIAAWALENYHVYFFEATDFDKGLYREAYARRHPVVQVEPEAAPAPTLHERLLTNLCQALDDSMVIGNSLVASRLTETIRASINLIRTAIVGIPARNLVVDGSTCEDRTQSVFDSDPAIGIYPPFVVFDINRQEFVSPNFEHRLEAERWLDGMERYMK